MAFKDILVHFENTPTGIKRLHAAASLAQTYEAHLAGLLLQQAPVPLIFDGAAAVDVLALEELARERIEAGFAAMTAALSQRNVSVEPRTARFYDGKLASVVAHHGRHSDLLVLGQPDPEGTILGRATLDEVLISTGRPVLVVPFIGPGSTIGERILIVWDGGREAARAVADALPLLERAKHVALISVNARGLTRERGERQDADIGVHLARHGVRVEVRHDQAEKAEPADLVLNAVADQDIDLIVMGAYGHSRMREFVLGGMTRSMLDHMTVPVLMSH